MQITPERICIETMLDALQFAKQKLRCYYDETKGVYPGGLPNDRLNPKIDYAIELGTKLVAHGTAPEQAPEGEAKAARDGKER